MDWVLVPYYAGYTLALYLCWSLGRIFRIPMLLNLGFNLSLNAGLLAGWDIRLLIVAHGFGFFAWVLGLSQTLTKSTFLLVLLLDVGIIFHRLVPDLQVVDTGPVFWNAVSTHIIDIWSVSVLGVIIAMVVRSTLGASWHGRHIDVLTNPKKRFQLPIGLWAGAIVLIPLFAPWLPASIVAMRHNIAANLLVWGWVATELPFYLMNRRLMRSVS